jgi:hypothetical protein
MAAFILGFGPLHTGIAKGQLSVVLVGMMALAVVLERRGKTVAAALLVALCIALKPQLGAPFVLLYVLQKRWKETALVGATWAALLACADLRLRWAAVPWIQPMLRSLRVAIEPGEVYDSSAANPLSYQLVNAAMLFQRIVHGQFLVNCLVGGMCLAVLYFLWRRGQSCHDLLGDAISIASISVLTLLVVAHRYYDAVLLVFPFAWALKDLSGRRVTKSLIVIVACLILSAPGPAFLVQMGLSVAPSFVPQAGWDIFVMPHQVWTLLVLMATLTLAIKSRFPKARVAVSAPALSA